MPADPRKRQKKLERASAKRKSKQREVARAAGAGLAERLTAGAEFPVLHSWVSAALWDQGMGWVCLSRSLPNGMVGFAVFLVDRYCLGVKNVMADILPRPIYDSKIVAKARSQFVTENATPAFARKLVEAAVEYARELGLAPHHDYQKAKHIFGSIDATECTEEFEFGKDGKPNFIAGPNDTPVRCKVILKTLEEHCGAGGFHYTIPMSRADQVRMLDAGELEDFSDEPDEEDEPK